MAPINTMEQNAKADARAIQQVLAGNPDAFEHLVDRHFPMVYAIAYARLGEVDAAEDLAQEVFLRAFLNLASLEKPEAFPSWVARMARNLGINWARSNTRASRLLPMVNLEDNAMDALPDERRTAREELESQERDAQLREAILALKPEEREMVLLHYMEGCSKKEIADNLGVHPSTVGRTLDRSLANLKGLLEPALREATRPMRASKRSRKLAMQYVTAAAVLSGGAREALASAVATGVSTGSSTSSTAASATALVGFFQQLWALIVGASATAKGIAVATTIVAASGGGYYYYQSHQEPSLPAFPSESGIVAQTGVISPNVLAIPNVYDGSVEGWRVKSVNHVMKNGDWVDSGITMTTRVNVVEADSATGLYAFFTIEDFSVPNSHQHHYLIPSILGYQYFAETMPAGSIVTMEPSTPAEITADMSKYIGQSMRADISTIVCRPEWVLGEEYENSTQIELPGFEGSTMNMHSTMRYEGLRQVDGQDVLMITSDFEGDMGDGFRMLDYIQDGVRVEVYLDNSDFHGNAIYLLDPETRQLRVAEYTTFTENIRSKTLRHVPGEGVVEQMLPQSPDEQMRESIRIEYL